MSKETKSAALEERERRKRMEERQKLYNKQFEVRRADWRGKNRRFFNIYIYIF